MSETRRKDSKRKREDVNDKSEPLDNAIMHSRGLANQKKI
jgi:hypothetical protein